MSSKGKHAAVYVEPDLLTSPIDVNPVAKVSKLEHRLEQLLAELDAWRDLHLRWGEINGLVGAINDLYWLLGYDKEIVTTATREIKVIL